MQTSHPGRTIQPKAWEHSPGYSAAGVREDVMTEQVNNGSGDPLGRTKSFALLVDGYAKDLFTTGMMLQRLGHEVYITGSGEDALKIIDSALPVLVMSELSLPQMSGLELLIRIKHEARSKGIPVIIQTAADDEKKKELCRVSGCVAFLKKPTDPVALYNAIQQATEPIPRQFIRLRTLLPAMVAGSPSGPGTPAGTEYVTDISEAGIFVRTLYPRQLGSTHAVTIIIRTIPIKVKAMVVYSVMLNPGLFKEPGMGMKFVEISPTDREVIRNIIKGQILKDITG